ncbi:MAG: DUF1178 family protein [Hyphomicrobiaceae bacterium]
MIRYNLQCDKGHAFEGWFRSSDDYDRQRKRRLVTCPSCGATKVEKAIMAPNVVTSEQAKSARRKKARELAVSQTAPASEPTAPVAAAGAGQSLAVTPEQREVLRRMRELRDQMLKASDYVGPKFAEEARRIHDEDAPKRGIHGEASPDEVKALLEDGIEVLPIPVLPDDSN